MALFKCFPGFLRFMATVVGHHADSSTSMQGYIMFLQMSQSVSPNSRVSLRSGMHLTSYQGWIPSSFTVGPNSWKTDLGRFTLVFLHL